jgi:hypothetical protein
MRRLLRSLSGRDDKDQADRPQDDGLAAIDLASLPPQQLKIMRLMLRQPEMSYPRLCAAVEAMPEAERLSRAELDAALAIMLEQGWLIRADDNQPITYKANLRRRSAGRLDSFAPRRKSGSALTQGLWDALDADSTPDPKKPPTPGDDKS